jgi:predicted transcriptional regulator
MARAARSDEAGPPPGGTSAAKPGSGAVRARDGTPARHGGDAPPARDGTPTPPGDGALRPSGTPPAPRRDEAAVSRFIEDFASSLVEMGVPRMPARVLVALLTSDSGRLTAGELAARLRASPAAVSGAVRYLVQIGLARRESEPGSRRHYYRVPDHCWDELISIRDRMMSRWTGVLREGVGILGADTPAGARIAESVRYFEFVSSELPLVIARWREYRAALGDGQAAADR